MKTRLVLALSAMSIVAAGCEFDHLGRPVNRQRFVMGIRGEGRIVYAASGKNGEQSGECALPECRTTVDFDTVIVLTPFAGDHYRFKWWDGLPASNLTCYGDVPNDDGTIKVNVAYRDSACIAVFEAIGGSGTTVPGAR